MKPEEHEAAVAEATERAKADEAALAKRNAEEAAKITAADREEAERKAAVAELTPRYQSLYEAGEHIAAAKGMMKNAIIARRRLTQVEVIEIGKALTLAQEKAGKSWNGISGK